MEGDELMHTCIAPTATRDAILAIVAGGEWEALAESESSPGDDNNADNDDNDDDDDDGKTGEQAGRWQELVPIRRLSSPGGRRSRRASDPSGSLGGSSREASRRPSEEASFLLDASNSAHAHAHGPAAPAKPRSGSCPPEGAELPTRRSQSPQRRRTPLEHLEHLEHATSSSAEVGSPDGDAPIRRCSPLAVSPAPQQATAGERERAAKLGGVPVLKLPPPERDEEAPAPGGARDVELEGPGAGGEAGGRCVVELEVRDECPGCHKTLYETDILASWQMDEQDYTTACGFCARKFVARFRVRRAGGDSSGGAEGPESFECLSPLVVKKELTTLMRSIDEPEEVERMRRARPDALTAAVAREEGFACYLRGRQPSIFWNLVWHFFLCKLPLHLLLRAEVLVRHSAESSPGTGTGRKARPAGSFRDFLRASPRTPSVD